MRGRFLILFVLIATVAGAQQRLDSLIEILVKEVDQQEVYVDQKKARIASLQGRLKSAKTDEQSFGIYNNLYQEYKTFNNDSAFKYAHKLIQTSRKRNDQAEIGYAHLKYGFALLSAGMFKETFDTLRAVNTKFLPDTSLVEYYRLSARACYESDRRISLSST